MAELKLDIFVSNLNKLKQQFSNISVGSKGTSTGGGVAKGDMQSSKKGMAGIIGISAGIGLLVGLVGGLLSSSESVQGILKIIGGFINQLVAPFVPILITLLKPALTVLMILMGFMLRFFRDPVGTLQKAFEGITGKIANLLGFEPSALTSLMDSILVSVSSIVTIFESIRGMFQSMATNDVEGARQNILGLLGGFVALLGGLFGIAFETLKILLVFLWLGLKTVLLFAWEGLKFIFLSAWEILKFVLKGVWFNLKSTFNFAWVQLQELLISVWNLLKSVFTTAWDLLVALFTGQWDELGTILKGIWQGLKDVFSNSWQGVKDAFKGLVSRIKNFGFGGGNSSSTTNVEDAVITPQGQVIKTDPRDFLLATKTPGSLLGGSGGNNINITINGGADSKTVNELMKRLRVELNRKGAF